MYVDEIEGWDDWILEEIWDSEVLFWVKWDDFLWCVRMGWKIYCVLYIIFDGCYFGVLKVNVGGNLELGWIISLMVGEGMYVGLYEMYGCCCMIWDWSFSSWIDEDVICKGIKCYGMFEVYFIFIGWYLIKLVVLMGMIDDVFIDGNGEKMCLRY